MEAFEGYFSVRMFAKDQFDIFGGQPFTVEKIIVLNGEKDSSMVSASLLDWGSILKTFFASDISDKKFLDRYNFSMFDDNVTDSRNYYYEAKDDELFTRSLQIITSAETNKIRSVFIETAKKGLFGSKHQKLYYVPVKLIQIQEFESSLFGKDRNLRLEYRFLY